MISYGSIVKSYFVGAGPTFAFMLKKNMIMRVDQYL